MQELAVQRGFRPVNEEVIASQVAQSPFLRWKDVGVAADITRLQGMRFLNRDVLDAILNFYRQDILGKQ
jgi:ABC-type sulfate transport system substrate-binding protein